DVSDYFDQRRGRRAVTAVSQYVTPLRRMQTAGNPMLGSRGRHQWMQPSAWRPNLRLWRLSRRRWQSTHSASAQLGVNWRWMRERGLRVTESIDVPSQLH